MKRFLLIPAVVIAVGCSSSAPAPTAEPGAAAAPAPDSKEQRVAILDAQIAGKQAELDSANSDLANIDAERKKLAKDEASPAKNNRLVELVKLETETKRRKDSLQLDIKELESQKAQLTAAKPKTAGDALDLALADANTLEKQEADRKRLEQEKALAEEQRRIAEAERKRQAQKAIMEKEKIEGGRATAEDSLFEEVWADVILQVRSELQKFKRW